MTDERAPKSDLPPRKIYENAIDQAFFDAGFPVIYVDEDGNEVDDDAPAGDAEEITTVTFTPFVDPMGGHTNTRRRQARRPT